MNKHPNNYYYSAINLDLDLQGYFSWFSKLFEANHNSQKLLFNQNHSYSHSHFALNYAILGLKIAIGFLLPFLFLIIYVPRSFFTNFHSCRYANWLSSLCLVNHFISELFVIILYNISFSLIIHGKLRQQIFDSID